ncbi:MULTISPECIES: hypothetical protein [Pseudomonas]|uniref:hypothetical protein n=1 Tax=Pseudomonas TaxID=286 RepID=UPI001071A91D|nr:MULTISPECIES: hypothetical protein [Pseudomonas]MDG9889996.1 hypothetical protein [Pseudomonas juntendi]QOH70659.1 hypothetical protein IGB31_24495 [Pseudomonas putida]
MWKSADYDHSLIQVSVCELDGRVEGDAEGLLACGTSCVSENYSRPGEMAFFKCELFKRKEQAGFRVVRTMVVTFGDWDGETAWSQTQEFFLAPDFEPSMRGVVVDELIRRTINEYGRRTYAHDNGLAYEPSA